MDKINDLKKIELKNKKYTTVVFLISIIVFGAYLVKLRLLIHNTKSLELTHTDFIRFFNVVLASLAVISCLITYRSNQKKELFLMCLVYIVFLLDIVLSNINNYKNYNVSTYIAIGSTCLRLLISFLAISRFENVKNLITKNCIKSIVLVVSITLFIIHLEYNHSFSQNTYDEYFYIIFNVFSALAYLFIAIIFFKRSIFESEYIYGVLATSILMFATKSVYAIVYQLFLIDEIRLTSVSITYVGFIILIIGLFIELIQNINKTKSLENQKDLFFNIVEESNYSNIIICNNDYDILYFNKKAFSNISIFNICGSAKTEDFTNLKEIFKDILNYSEIDDSLIKSGYSNKEIYITEDDLYMDISMQLFKKNDLIYKVVFFKDISEKYKMQSALLENENLKKEERMKKEFFANISHELKTPLNIIYSTAQLLNLSLSKDNFKDIYIKHKNSLDINCKRMIRLIDNIVDLTKLEVGFKKPNFVNYDIVKLVEDITMSIVNYANVKNINVVFDTQIEEFDIKCDPDMIERVILNLLSNAIKYTNNNGNILIDISASNDFVTIKIKDDGIGIPEYIQDRIYDRFVQGDKSFTRQNEGSGIGLSIVKSLVELMNGCISFVSDSENGTEFTLLLPVDLIDDDKADNIVKHYHQVDVHKIKLEFSDIYEIYDAI